MQNLKYLFFIVHNITLFIYLFFLPKSWNLSFISLLILGLNIRFSTWAQTFGLHWMSYNEQRHCSICTERVWKCQNQLLCKIMSYKVPHLWCNKICKHIYCLTQMTVTTWNIQFCLPQIKSYFNPPSVVMLCPVDPYASCMCVAYDLIKVKSDFY